MRYKNKWHPIKPIFTVSVFHRLQQIKLPGAGSELSNCKPLSSCPLQLVSRDDPILYVVEQNPCSYRNLVLPNCSTTVTDCNLLRFLHKTFLFQGALESNSQAGNQKYSFSRIFKENFPYFNFLPKW